jgi:hypothetical protein
MASIHPLFKWFGSKWLAAPKYPKPIYRTIVEPFAGGAGYALRHADRRVVICENDPHIYALWTWLIRDATAADIKAIPRDLPVGLDIRSLGLSNGQALLLKNWQRTNNAGNCWTVSPWGNKPGQWTANTQCRVAEEVYAIKHWEIRNDGMAALTDYALQEMTWFVDPMYQFNYQYLKSCGHDYGVLGRQLRAMSGQVIVCEAAEPKTGRLPDWLPFVCFGDRITSRRKVSNNHHSRELIWTNSPSANPPA